jgi:hypothetical protein
MAKQITIYTSLSPNLTRSIGGAEGDRSYVAECIKSWKRANFDVVSLNGVHEVESLAPLDYGIEFKPVSGDRPKISDFLNAIQDSGASIAGIINADIFLSDAPALLASIVDQAASGLVLAERINIDPETLRPTGRTCSGFDAFIFQTRPVSRISLDCELRFGEPWWDYWFPLAYLAAGGKLMGIDSPLFFHLDHKPSWQLTQWIANGKKVVEYLPKLSGELPPVVADARQKFLGHKIIPEEALVPFAHWCFAWLRMTAKQNRVELQPRAGNLATLIAQLDDTKTRDLIGELNIAYEQIQRMSFVGDGRPINSEDALFTLIEGARILTSRKASLLHFMALNARWLKTTYQGIRGHRTTKGKSSLRERSAEASGRQREVC